jgi:hypothetical protein
MNQNPGKLNGWAMRNALPSFFVCAFLFFLFTGCDFLSGRSGKGALGPQAEQTNQSAEPAGEVMSPKEKFGFHRWLVKEMYEQVYARPVKTGTDLNAWANVLGQRGSIEGVYHGIILSADYAAMETGKADLRALRFFAVGMSVLENPNLGESDPKLVSSSAALAKEHMNSSLFTLKRLLGAKVLHESAKRREDKEKLAAWYADLALRWAKIGVDFGLPQRNKAEEIYHFKWAQENNLGLLQWELLNRVHRIMNFYGGVAFSPAGK